jgi:uncharacterized protein YutE (UPF0331/DUF86 family)
MKNKSIRKDKIKTKIANIIDSINFVGEELPNVKKEFMSSRLIKNAIYKQIEFAIENIIDICSIINSDLDLGLPEDDETTIDHLERDNILSEEVVNKIRDIKRFRNILIHRYGDIDDNKAYDSIKEGLQDFEIIINDFEKLLKRY